LPAGEVFVFVKTAREIRRYPKEPDAFERIKMLRKSLKSNPNKTINDLIAGQHI
jgi:hypothetical protein